MKVADLSDERIEQIKAIRYDYILEKHEGPWGWASEFDYGEPEFLNVEENFVLLPIERGNHPNITILRSIKSEDGKTLTIFFKDTTYVSDPKSEWLGAGRIAVCEQMKDAEFYIATLFHEWMIIKNVGLA